MSTPETEKAQAYILARLPMMLVGSRSGLLSQNLSLYVYRLDIRIFVDPPGVAKVFINGTTAETDEEYALDASARFRVETTPENAVKRVVDTLRRYREKMLPELDAFLASVVTDPPAEKDNLGENV
jgi:hypothetical protein